MCLQPENILLDGKQKVVKISDFGFSTSLPEGGLSGEYVYTVISGYVLIITGDII